MAKEWRDVFMANEWWNVFMAKEWRNVFMAKEWWNVFMASLEKSKIEKCAINIFTFEKFLYKSKGHLYDQEMQVK